MGDKHQVVSYPLRMEPEVRREVEALAKQEDRSLNWLINALVKMAMPMWAARRKMEERKQKK